MWPPDMYCYACFPADVNEGPPACRGRRCAGGVSPLMRSSRHAGQTLQTVHEDRALPTPATTPVARSSRPVRLGDAVATPAWSPSRCTWCSDAGTRAPTARASDAGGGDRWSEGIHEISAASTRLGRRFTNVVPDRPISVVGPLIFCPDDRSRAWVH